MDGLGVGALNIHMISRLKPRIFEAGTKARDYDLVMIHTGTNMWAPKRHPQWAKAAISLIRKSLGPDVSSCSCLLLTSVIRKRSVRMADCSREKRQIARNEKAAFWDFYHVMGSWLDLHWRKVGYAAPDYVHLKEGLHKMMMENFANTLLQNGKSYWREQAPKCKI